MSDKSNTRVTKTVVVPSGNHVEKAQRPGERPVAPATQKPTSSPAQTPKSGRK